MFAKSDLVRESGMVLLLLIDRGGVSFRLNFLALLTRLLPERLRPLRSGWGCEWKDDVGWWWWRWSRGCCCWVAGEDCWEEEARTATWVIAGGHIGWAVKRRQFFTELIAAARALVTTLTTTGCGWLAKLKRAKQNWRTKRGSWNAITPHRGFRGTRSWRTTKWNKIWPSFSVLFRFCFLLFTIVYRSLCEQILVFFPKRNEKKMSFTYHGCLANIDYTFAGLRFWSFLVRKRRKKSFSGISIRICLSRKQIFVLNQNKKN